MGGGRGVELRGRSRVRERFNQKICNGLRPALHHLLIFLLISSLIQSGQFARCWKFLPWTAGIKDTSNR